MLALFKKQSRKEKLQKKYQKLLEEAEKLAATNQNASVLKSLEAKAILHELEACED
ncbi:Lacal_2735 family protein [Flammeovirgaceae bacterium SG7u.111]|nr:Lacal_2735 family protein [Flammeovirgaceae bacterium SG7u.132]WPO38178.1 Lacal_2735 family protein [Flammeovirgaceae bacterium SG7u.111]